MFVIADSWPVGGAPLGLPWATHLLLLAAVGVEILFRVLKLTLSARAIGVRASLGVSARTVLGGDFAASVTPSRSGSEPARFLVMREAGIAVPQILLVLFLELFLEMVSLAVLAVGFGIVWREESGMVRGLLITVGVYSTGVLGAGAVGYVLAHRASGPAPRWLQWLGVRAGLWRRVQLSLRQLRSSIGSLRTARRGLMAAALVCSVLHVAARLLTLPILLYSYGETAPLSKLVLWPMALLYGAAVAPAPAGGGLVEFAFRAALGGVLPARLVAASLIWWRVYSFYIYIVIGAIAAGRTAMKALRRGSEHSPGTADQSPRPDPA